VCGAGAHGSAPVQSITRSQRHLVCVAAAVALPSTGVPTVWLNLLQHVRQHGLSMRHLRRVCIAGSAPPRSMIEALEG
jgi:hypothetical protein